MPEAPKIGLIGFGRAGKAVATVLLESKDADLQWVLRKSRKLEHHSVPEFLGVESEEAGFILCADEFSAAELLDMFPVDVIVDFSGTEALRYYGEEAKRRKLTVISAVAEYGEEDLAYLKTLSHSIRVLHSDNVTLGINFLLIAAKVLKRIAPDSDIQIIEEHFRSKTEVSGPARMLADGLDVPQEEIKSIRAGGIIGVHEVLFGFPFQTVRLKHDSIAREAFGTGILFALQNLPAVPSGLFSMEDLLTPHFDLRRAEAAGDTASLWRFWPGI